MMHPLCVSEVCGAAVFLNLVKLLSPSYMKSLLKNKVDKLLFYRNFFKKIIFSAYLCIKYPDEVSQLSSVSTPNLLKQLNSTRFHSVSDPGVTTRFIDY